MYFSVPIGIFRSNLSQMENNILLSSKSKSKLTRFFVFSKDLTFRHADKKPNYHTEPLKNVGRYFDMSHSLKGYLIISFTSQ